jgi:ubiquinone biosynthesis protein Coq4
VLSGYNPHPYGEMLLAAFHAGNTPPLAIELLLRSLLQYHHGIRIDDGPARGLLVPDEFFRAYARGHAMTVDLHRTDWNALLERDLDEVRRELGLVP